MKTITLTNAFHGTETTVRLRPDGTISAAVYRRVRQALCPSASCRCGVPAALNGALPVYEGCRLVAWKVD